MQKFRTVFGRTEPQLSPYGRDVVKKMKETGILIDKSKNENPKRVRTLAALAEGVREAPSISIQRSSSLKRNFWS